MINWRPIVERLRSNLPEYPVYYVAPNQPGDSAEVEITLTPGPLEVESGGEITGVLNQYRRFFSVQIFCETTEENQLLEELLERVQTAMIGYQIVELGQTIRYEGGDPEYIEGHLVRWTEQYSVGYHVGYSYSS